MGKNELPGFLKKRNILYNTKNKETLKKHGDDYLAAGQLDDAMEFYTRAQSIDELRKMIESAKANADLVLYNKIFKSVKAEPLNDDLNEIGRLARELGKFATAKHAFEQAGNDAMLREIEEKLEQESPNIKEGKMGEEE